MKRVANVRIAPREAPGGGFIVELDGHDVANAVSKVELTMTGGAGTRMVLTSVLAGHAADLTAEDVDVSVDVITAAMLVQLGWRAPTPEPTAWPPMFSQRLTMADLPSGEDAPPFTFGGGH